MNRKVIAAAASGLLLIVMGAVSQAHACVCVQMKGPQTVFDAATRELNAAAAVFSGKVVRLEWQKGVPNRRFSEALEWENKVVVFKVDKWWKTSLPDEVALITDEWRSTEGTSGTSSCNYYFSEGKSYLVFASGPKTELRTHVCTGTRPIDGVSREFLEALGPGHDPVRKFEAGKHELLSRYLSYPSIPAAADGPFSFAAADGSERPVPGTKKAAL